MTSIAMVVEKNKQENKARIQFHVYNIIVSWIRQVEQILVCKWLSTFYFIFLNLKIALFSIYKHSSPSIASPSSNLRISYSDSSNFLIWERWEKNSLIV